jgi:hypothetical protein
VRFRGGASHESDRETGRVAAHPYHPLRSKKILLISKYLHFFRLIEFASDIFEMGFIWLWTYGPSEKIHHATCLDKFANSAQRCLRFRSGTVCYRRRKSQAATDFYDLGYISEHFTCIKWMYKLLTYICKGCPKHKDIFSQCYLFKWKYGLNNVCTYLLMAPRAFASLHKPM